MRRETITGRGCMPKMDIEKVAQAIEADAGQKLPDLRQALAEVEQIRAGNLKGCRITRAASKEETLERLPLLLAELGKYHSGERPEFEAE